MVATSGDVLLAPEAVMRSKGDLLAPGDPGYAQSSRKLRSCSEAEQAGNEEEMVAQAKALLGATGCHAVLIKGGHGVGADATDILVGEAGVERFVRPRVATPHSHGTGCTLSAAIAALSVPGRGPA